MSAEATGWVFRHSPFNGVTFNVHLAIADTVSDAYDWTFWMSQGRLAAKARCCPESLRKALADLLAGGYLEELEPMPQTRPGRPVRRFRFLFPKAAVVFDSRRSPGEAQKPNPQPLGIEPPATGDSNPQPLVIEPKEEPKENPRQKPSSSDDDKPAIALALETEAPDPLRGFSEFWEAYPRRNGKRLGRSLCENNWQRLSLEERRAAWRGAKNYAAACASGLQGAMDPQRFLKHRCWTDWQEPAKPDNRRYGTPARPRVTPAEEILAQQRAMEERRQREARVAEEYIEEIKARRAASAHA